MRNNRWRTDDGFDVDLDDGSSNYKIYNNLMLRGGLKMREGFRRVVTNNIIVNNSVHPHVSFKNSGDVVKHNILMGPYQPIYVDQWDWDWDNNLFTGNVRSRRHKSWARTGTQSSGIRCSWTPPWGFQGEAALSRV
jgi:hypothetical protein